MSWDEAEYGVVYHVGLPKTGSSAIQRFLKTNRDGLARRGRLYPLFNPFPEGGAGGVDSGNGYKLARYVSGDASLSARRAWENYQHALGGRHARLIVSSELICQLTPDQIQALDKPAAEAGGTRLFAIVVRNIRDFYASNYLQRLKLGKASDFSGWFEQAARRRLFLSAVQAVVEAVEATEKTRLAWIDFDRERAELIPRFCARALGLTRLDEDFALDGEPANRSLSGPEQLLVEKLSDVDPERCATLYAYLSAREPARPRGDLAFSPRQVALLAAEAEAVRPLLPQGWPERTLEVETAAAPKPERPAEAALEEAAAVIARLLEERERRPLSRGIRYLDQARKTLQQYLKRPAGGRGGDATGGR